MTRCVIALLVLSLVACTSYTQTASGIVTEVNSTQLGSVHGFTLGTDTQEVIEFAIGGPVALDGDSFPPDHLREHLAAAEAIRVTYTRRDGMRIVLRLTDAQ